MDMINKTLAHYEVKEKIGEGGMGEVYRARDTKLGRDVALKFLPESFAVDAERLGRFEREAKLLATLNHANIAAIYGIEQSNSQRYLVLELVEGLDLAQRLAQGPIPEDDTLQVCLQVASALEAAHEQGVVHRDLKPANIKVTPDGRVKVLDFGLAKALELDSGSDHLSHSPTLLASSPTMQGVILGTAAYMSPEQARGKAVDRRADIWAFGCVLFEMLTAKQAFSGETLSDTLASVLKTHANWNLLPAGTPSAIRKLLHRCLDKDPKQRLRDIGEARIVLERVLRGEADEEAASPTVATARRAPLQKMVWPAAAIVLAVVATAVAWSLKGGASDPPLRKFSLAIESEDGRGPNHPVLSPDGTKVVYMLSGGLWLHEFSELAPRQLPTQDHADMPFWSHDGSFIGYLSDGELWKVPVGGGATVKICDPQPNFTGGRGASWGADDHIVFSYGSTDGLQQVSAQGGDPTPFLAISAETETDFHEPSLLPDGRGVVFVTHRKTGTADTIELAADGKRTMLVRVEGQRLWHPVYSPSGHVLYRRSGPNGGIWALPFSLSGLEVTGEAFLVAGAGAYPSASSDGTLGYLRGGSEDAYQLIWLGRDGTFGDPVGEPGPPALGDPALSPDGKRLAVVENRNDETDIWIHDLARGTRTRFTFAEGPEFNPEWSHDGSEIFYMHQMKDSIFARRADGTGEPRPIAAGGSPSVSRDGQFLAFQMDRRETQSDIEYMPLDGSGEAKSFRATPADEFSPRISPDGRYLAYVSNESGQGEVYLTRFPSGEGKWQVSIGGGGHPQWARDGRKLFYRQGGCDIVEVTVDTEPVLALGKPVQITNCEELRLPTQWYRTYTVDGNGERFLILRIDRPEGAKVDIGITVVQNWLAEFASRDGK
jgi:serine/threonine protein kinase